MADRDLAGTAALRPAPSPTRQPAGGWPVALRLAVRDLRGGLTGLRLLFLCLFLCLHLCLHLCLYPRQYRKSCHLNHCLCLCLY